MRAHSSTARLLVAWYMTATVSSVLAGDPFTVRCVALKARLATLDCKEVFGEARSVLADGQPYILDMARELKANRERIVALAEVLKETSRVAQNCAIKHLKDRPSVFQAQARIDELHFDMERWISHKWAFPPDFARKYQRDLAEKHSNALEAVSSVHTKW